MNKKNRKKLLGREDGQYVKEKKILKEYSRKKRKL